MRQVPGASRAAACERSSSSGACGALIATRRTALSALLPSLVAALCTGDARPVLASQEGRVTAQGVGIDQKNVGLLADPRAFIDGDGVQPLIWGGRDRCDPTDATCTAGGQAVADAAVQPVPTTPLEPSVKVAFDLSISGQPAGRLNLGLDRAAGPASVEAFVRLCRGTLVSEPDDEPASFDSSRALRVERDKAVVLGDVTKKGGSLRLVSGRTKPLRVPVVPPSNEDTNSFSHDQPGLLSVRRGGGSFQVRSRALARGGVVGSAGPRSAALAPLQKVHAAARTPPPSATLAPPQFTLTPRANMALDRENLVIGKVLDADGMELLARLNSLPVNNYDGGPIRAPNPPVP